MNKLSTFVGTLTLLLSYQNCAPNNFSTDLSSYSENGAIPNSTSSVPGQSSSWQPGAVGGTFESGGAVFSFDGCTDELKQAKAACDAVYAKGKTACSVIETVSGHTLYKLHGFGPAVSKKITCGTITSGGAGSLPPVNGGPVAETPPSTGVPPVGSSSDPGSGIWIPDVNAKPLVVVVDQGGASNLTFLPGCLNYRVGSGIGASREEFASCDRLDTFQVKINGKTRALRLGPDVIFSIRYRTGPAGVVPAKFTMRNSIGGNIGIVVKMSVSATPGDMTGMNMVKCVDESWMTPGVSFGNKFGCSIDFSLQPFHYVNIHAVDQRCLDSVCKEILFEPIFNKAK